MSRALAGHDTHTALPAAATVLGPQARQSLRLLTPSLGLYVASGHGLHAGRGQHVDAHQRRQSALSLQPRPGSSKQCRQCRVWGVGLTPPGKIRRFSNCNDWAARQRQHSQLACRDSE